MRAVIGLFLIPSITLHSFEHCRRMAQTQRHAAACFNSSQKSLGELHAAMMLSLQWNRDMQCCKNKDKMLYWNRDMQCCKNKNGYSCQNLMRSGAPSKDPEITMVPVPSRSSPTLVFAKAVTRTRINWMGESTWLSN